MKAILITETGGPEKLALRDVEKPRAAAGQAVVEIKASGVNFIDVYFREGRYPAALPFVPGQEAAGVVAEVGEGVTTVRVGDRVAWSSVQGTYAEFAAVPAAALVKLPEGLGFEQGAAAMLQGMTAHYLTESVYPVKKNDVALVHAAAGGVGLLLVQMVKRRGGRVVATVSNEAKAELARAAGADEVILYTRDDFAAETRRLTGGAGVQVVYDGVGKDTFEGSLKSLARRGMMALFGGASGAVPAFDLIRLSQMGSLFVTRPKLGDYTATRAELEWRAGDVLRWVAAGEVKLRIEHRYPLSEARRAHEDLQGRRTTGKLILVV